MEPLIYCQIAPEAHRTVHSSLVIMLVRPVLQVVASVLTVGSLLQNHVQLPAYSLKEAHSLELGYDEEVGVKQLESGGLSWNYYHESCPYVQSVVRDTLKGFLEADITQAAGLLRLHFHDCFVLGCDASILLVGNASEQTAPPNLSLRTESFKIINIIKEKLEEICPNKVSCADIVALAARDSVFQAKGPRYPVLLGRRDGLVYANRSVVLASLPPPSSNVSQLLTAFNAIGLDTVDLVTLSGGHTIGRAHCPSFAARLYPEDPNLDPTFAAKLKTICPTTNSTNFTNLDVITPDHFDNRYYAAVVSEKGLLNSDSVLTLDGRTSDIVTSFAIDQQLFFWHFGLSMIKMGSVGVLTGTQGEVRSSCTIANPSSIDESLLIASS